mmetsp:Transcript_55649/g.92151  ORF Transcript_55649/g.92151 Transcript_55649/m.92151 type:complete len:90 (+) Transcript_55649:554-823(+)
MECTQESESSDGERQGRAPQARPKRSSAEASARAALLRSEKCSLLAATPALSSPCQPVSLRGMHKPPPGAELGEAPARTSSCRQATSSS